VCAHTNCGEQPVEGTAGDIAMLPVGATLEMSAVLGKGFDMSKADKASDILIFATGSGIRCRLAFPSVLSPPGHLSSSGRKEGAGDGAFGALEHGKACDGHVGRPSLPQPPLSYAAMVTNRFCTGVCSPRGAVTPRIWPHSVRAGLLWFIQLEPLLGSPRLRSRDSPIRALLEADAEHGGLEAIERNSVRLYYGAQDKAKMAFTDRFKAWEASGVTVVPVFSQVRGLNFRPACAIDIH
jgi:hypothetical protein